MCSCFPRVVVRGYLWAYRADLGWHDPAEHQSQPEAPCTPS